MQQIQDKASRKLRLPSINLRKYFNPDKIVGTSAFIISLGTFLALVYQTRISQEQAQISQNQFRIALEQAELNRKQFQIFQEQSELNRKALYASILPNLELYDSWASGKYELILENTGLGPAFIREIRVHYKGKTYEGDQHYFLQKVLLSSQKVDYTYATINKGDVIPAGRKVSLVFAHNPYSNSEKLKELFGSQTARIEIIYSSVYEEKWKIDGMKPPQKLE